MTELVKYRSDFDVELIDSMGSDDRICQAARVSGKALAAGDSEASAGLIKFLASNRHGSPFEHTAMTFMITEPIFVTREFHRHRIGWSYNEESSRWRQMEPVFYVLPNERPIVQVDKPGAYKLEAGDFSQKMSAVVAQTTLAASAYRTYEALLEDGVAREVARQILPVNLYTSFYATCNARSLMNFLSLRMDDTALWEIRRVANQAFAHFKNLFPITADAFVEAGRRSP